MEHNSTRTIFKNDAGGFCVLFHDVRMVSGVPQKSKRSTDSNRSEVAVKRPRLRRAFLVDVVKLAAEIWGKDVGN